MCSPSTDAGRREVAALDPATFARHRIHTAERDWAETNCYTDVMVELLRRVGLEPTRVAANDPFFGRGGKLMKATQLEQELKYELLVPIVPGERPAAVTSSNYHLDHFGLAFGIRTADGAAAHSACIGFGLERIALALLSKHGFEPKSWPREARDVLALD